MVDLVGTCPKGFWLQWLMEGDAAGEPATGTEYGWWTFLSDGVLQVERQDAPYLLDVKLGKWTLEEVQKEAERLFALTEQAFINSPLPPKPDHDKINEKSDDIDFRNVRGTGRLEDPANREAPELITDRWRPQDKRSR